MNKVILMGRMTADAELKPVGNEGNCVTNFTLAVNRQRKKDETDFIRCTAWGKTAELICNYLGKGRQVALTGRLETGSYPVEKDGVAFTQSTADVIVDEIHFISDGKGGNTSNSNNQATAPTFNTVPASGINANADNQHNVAYEPSTQNLENLDSLDSIPGLF